MKKLIMVIATSTLLSACSSFFNKNTAFETVKKVAVVSIYVDRDLGQLYGQKNNDQKNTLKLDKQGLMHTTQIALNQKMAAHLAWQVLPDIRNTALNQVQGSEDLHYEGFKGVALLSPEDVQHMSNGHSPNQNTLALIKAICQQLKVDALAVLMIDSKTHHQKLLSFFSNDDLPEISLRVAVVNQAGDLILNTDEFPVAYVADGISAKALSHESDVLANEKILTVFQAGIQGALDQYFYQSAQEFKRMGYVLNKNTAPQSLGVDAKSVVPVQVLPAPLDKTRPKSTDKNVTTTKMPEPELSPQRVLVPPQPQPERKTETAPLPSIAVPVKPTPNRQGSAIQPESDKKVSDKKPTDLWSTPVGTP
ncbi:MAG TPA: hypothetical protein VFV48_08770 [Pseudomonadales bacterium]|nr:hypothetical protein [Pseudomonadales bacterium]